MKTKSFSLTIFICSLIFASIACNVFVGGPDYPAQSIPVSGDDVQNMHTQIEEAIAAGAGSGVVSLQITESQLTSFITQKLLAQNDPPFTDPQILLRNGQMQMYGKITQGIFYANILITMNVGIDETTGLPKIEIASADFGPFPAPEGMNAAISKLISEVFTGSFGPVAFGFRLETITISDGLMTMTGRIK